LSEGLVIRVRSCQQLHRSSWSEGRFVYLERLQGAFTIE
jgi:hypothetical protein